MTDKRVAEPGRQRRRYSKQFKAELVAEAMTEGKSIASLAREHQMNANLLHRWVSQHKRHGHHDLEKLQSMVGVPCSTGVETAGAWIELATDTVSPAVVSDTDMPPVQSAQTSPPTVALSIASRRNIQVDLEWPCDESVELARFVRGLLT